MNNRNDSDPFFWAIMILFLAFIINAATGCDSVPSEDLRGQYTFSEYCERVPPDPELYPMATVAYHDDGTAWAYHLYGVTYKELCTDIIFTLNP